MNSTSTILAKHSLLILQFDKYEDASEKVYRILLKHTGVVQPLSCDEAFLDISGLGEPLALAAKIRQEVTIIHPEERDLCLARASGLY